MIKRRKLLGSVYQYYLYVGGLYDGWFTVAQMVSMPECSISHVTLSNRLNSARHIKNINKQKSVFDCLSASKSVSRETRLKDSKQGRWDTTERDAFVGFLNLFPTGSLSHTVK